MTGRCTYSRASHKSSQGAWAPPQSPRTVMLWCFYYGSCKLLFWINRLKTMSTERASNRLRSKRPTHGGNHKYSFTGWTMWSLGQKASCRVRKNYRWGSGFFIFVRKAEIHMNETSLSFWHYSIELALMIDLATHCMFLNNDKCTVEINWNTESKIIAEKYPAFRLLVAKSMNYAAYANLKSVAG